MRRQIFQTIAPLQLAATQRARVILHLEVEQSRCWRVGKAMKRRDPTMQNRAFLTPAADSSPVPGKPAEIPDVPPATVPEQQPDILPEPLGPDIPDQSPPAPDVPQPDEIPPQPVNPGQL